MREGKISVQTENIFPIIKQFLYSDQEIFLRELVSNAVDATQKLKTLSSKGEYQGELGDLKVEIQVDKEAKTLSIKDYGIGLSVEEAEKYLNQVAFSSAQEFIEKYQADNAIIGHFGLGFYSAFMVADKVVVESLSRNGGPAVRWTCDGNPEYTIEEIEKDDRGTIVTLHISDDATEYLEDAKISELLEKYCKFLPVPIEYGTEEIPVEGEDDKTESQPRTINNPEPLWKKSPADLTDEDYKSFYQELYPYSQPPLFWIHLNIDYPFNLTGVLYFPKLVNNIELQKNKIHLYSNQVFVTDEVKEIVPEFLTLLHGVIDSPDIPLNVSRSYLQADSNVKKISSYISKKVSEKLKSLFKEDRPAYEEKWSQVGTLVKYGMITDDKFYDRATDYLIFKNTEDEHFTIEEYRDKVKEHQTNKHDKKVVIYTPDAAAHHSYITSVRDKGYDVIISDSPLDNHLYQQLETKESDFLFVRVDSATPDQLIDKDEKAESVLSEKEEKKIKSIFEKGLDSYKDKLQLQALSPTDHPVIITKPEFMRRMQEMQAMQGMDMGMNQMEFFDIIVNTNHPLIAQKMTKMRGAEKKQDFAKYLFDLARLNQKMLTGNDLTEFIQRSLQFMEE